MERLRVAVFVPAVLILMWLLVSYLIGIPDFIDLIDKLEKFPFVEEQVEDAQTQFALVIVGMFVILYVLLTLLWESVPGAIPIAFVFVVVTAIRAMNFEMNDTALRWHAAAVILLFGFHFLDRKIKNTFVQAAS